MCFLAWHVKWPLPVSNGAQSWVGQDSPLAEVSPAASALYWRRRLPETSWVRHFSVGNYPHQGKVVPSIWTARFFLSLTTPVLGKQEKQCIVFLVTNGFKGFVLASSPPPRAQSLHVTLCHSVVSGWIKQVRKWKQFLFFFLFFWSGKNLLNGEPFFMLLMHKPEK